MLTKYFFFLFAGNFEQKDELTQNLKFCYNVLAEHMVLIELIPWLLSNDVLTSYDAQSIKACHSSFRQNCRLLDLMMMKSDQQIQTFIKGLIECDQANLAQEIDVGGKE